MTARVFQALGAGVAYGLMGAATAFVLAAVREHAGRRVVLVPIPTGRAWSAATIYLAWPAVLTCLLVELLVTGVLLAAFRAGRILSEMWDEALVYRVRQEIERRRRGED